MISWNYVPFIEPLPIFNLLSMTKEGKLEEEEFIPFPIQNSKFEILFEIIMHMRWDMPICSALYQGGSGSSSAKASCLECPAMSTTTLPIKRHAPSTVVVV